MPTKKLLPNEQIVTSIVERDLWRVFGIAAAIEGETKRNIIEKALTLYLEVNHKDLLKGVAE